MSTFQSRYSTYESAAHAKSTSKNQTLVGERRSNTTIKVANVMCCLVNVKREFCLCIVYAYSVSVCVCVCVCVCMFVTETEAACLRSRMYFDL